MDKNNDIIYGSEEYSKGFRYPGSGGVLRKDDDKLFLFEQPKGTKKIYKSYDGGCCLGDEETFYILPDNKMHGPYCWEYSNVKWFWFWEGKSVSKEEYEKKYISKLSKL